MDQKKINRRDFSKQMGIGGLGVSALLLPNVGVEQTPFVSDNINHLGPKKGYTPHIGAMVSMLDWVRDTVIRYHSRLTVNQLDHLFDKDSNTIGSLMMHLAATEVIYQDITFHNLEDFSPENKKKWGVAMDLGEKARTDIKGNTLSYYKDLFNEVREETNKQMKKKDDKWLFTGETKDWDWNNYCKWFHVVEHYANHRGQITWFMRRIPA